MLKFICQKGKICRQVSARVLVLLLQRKAVLMSELLQFSNSIVLLLRKIYITDVKIYISDVEIYIPDVNIFILSSP